MTTLRCRGCDSRVILPYVGDTPVVDLAPLGEMRYVHGLGWLCAECKEEK